MKRRIHAGGSHANQGRASLVKIREVLRALHAITLEGSVCVFARARIICHCCTHSCRLKPTTMGRRSGCIYLMQYLAR
jgi:hypothetical protein